MKYKKVNLVITVPDSDYCWDGRAVCAAFDNEGGHGRCVLLNQCLDQDKTGYYKKFEKCRKSKTVQTLS